MNDVGHALTLVATGIAVALVATALFLPGRTTITGIKDFGTALQSAELGSLGATSTGGS